MNIHRKEEMWKKLSMCFSGDEELFHSDGSLLDVQGLRRRLSLRPPSRRERRVFWPYLLNLYSPTMTTIEKDQLNRQAKIRYEKYFPPSSGCRCSSFLLCRLKSSWQLRLSRSDPFYVRLADQICKDISRTDQHLSFFQSKRRLFWLISSIGSLDCRKEIDALQHHDELQCLSSIPWLSSRSVLSTKRKRFL